MELPAPNEKYGNLSDEAKEFFQERFDEKNIPLMNNLIPGVRGFGALMADPRMAHPYESNLGGAPQLIREAKKYEEDGEFSDEFFDKYNIDEEDRKNCKTPEDLTLLIPKLYLNCQKGSFQSDRYIEKTLKYIDSEDELRWDSKMDEHDYSILIKRLDQKSYNNILTHEGVHAFWLNDPDEIWSDFLNIMDSTQERFDRKITMSDITNMIFPEQLGFEIFTDLIAINFNPSDLEDEPIPTGRIPQDVELQKKVRGEFERCGNPTKEMDEILYRIREDFDELDNFKDIVNECFEHSENKRPKKTPRTALGGNKPEFQREQRMSAAKNILDAAVEEGRY